MFNLGSRRMVINRDALVTEKASAGGEAGVVTILGFGDFTIPTLAEAALRGGAITVSSAAALGVYTAVVPGFNTANRYNIAVRLRHVREISGFYTDGNTISFQTGAGANIGAAAAAGQIAGFNDSIVKFSGTGNNLVISLQPGYEGAYIETVVLTDSATEDNLPVTSIAITTAPSYGVGLGKIIEEEVQNSTEANSDPYGLGGKDIVDVRGKYTEILWNSPKGTISAGWESHASLGRNDTNTEATYGPTTHVVYVNEASAADTIALITKLVNGEAVVA